MRQGDASYWVHATRQDLGGYARNGEILTVRASLKRVLNIASRAASPLICREETRKESFKHNPLQKSLLPVGWSSFSLASRLPPSSTLDFL